MACGSAALIACSLVGTCLLWPASAAADSPRIALVGVPDVLTEATTTALSSWHIAVIDLPPDRALIAQRARARQIAAEHRAIAVIWLEPAGDAYALGYYDAAQNRTQTRSLAARLPLDEPAAASIALSIKTFLRNSGMGPGTPARAPAKLSTPGDASDANDASAASASATLTSDPQATLAKPALTRRHHLGVAASTAVRIGRAGGPGPTPGSDWTRSGRRASPAPTTRSSPASSSTSATLSTTAGLTASSPITRSAWRSRVGSRSQTRCGARRQSVRHFT